MPNINRFFQTLSANVFPPLGLEFKIDEKHLYTEFRLHI